MRRFAAGLLGPVISIVAIVIVLQSVDIGETADALGETRLVVLIPAIGLVACGIFVRSLRWQRLLLPIAARAVPMRRITPILLIGYLGNATLPARLGEPIRAYLMARSESLRGFEVFGTVILERILDVAVLAVMAFLAALAVSAPLWLIQLTGLAAGFGVLVLGVLVLVGLGPVIRALEHFAARIEQPQIRMILGKSAELARGLGVRSKRLPVAEATALTIPIWLIDTAICWLVVWSLGFELSPAASLLVLGVGTLGTAIPSAPGYLGTYELAVSAAARAMGLEAPVALSLAIVMHAVTLLPVVLAGAICLISLGFGSLTDVARAAAESRKEGREADR